MLKYLNGLEQQKAGNNKVIKTVLIRLSVYSGVAAKTHFTRGV